MDNLQPTARMDSVTTPELYMLLLCMFEPSKLPAVCVCLDISGPLEFDRLEAATRRIIDRYQSLRTSFVNLSDSVLSVDPASNVVTAFRRKIESQMPSNVHFSDVSDLPAHEQERFVETIKAGENTRTFDFTKPPLFHFHLVRCSPSRHFFFATFHHLVFDGWSVDVFLRALEGFYRSEGNVNDANKAADFGDYLSWYRKQVENPNYQSMVEQYWLKYMGGEFDCHIERDLAPVGELTFEYHRVRFSVPTPLTPAAFLTKFGVSYATVMLAAFGLAVAEQRNKEKVYVINVTSGRMPSTFNEAIGSFASAIFVRIGRGSFVTALDLMKAVQAEIPKSMMHSLQGVPSVISALSKAGLVEPDYLGDNAKPKVIVNFLGVDPSEANLPRRLSDATTFDLVPEADERPGFFEISLTARASDRLLYGRVESWKECYTAERNAQLEKRFNGILCAMLADPTTHLADLLP